MVFGDLFKSRQEKSFQRQLKQKEQLGLLEARQGTLEREAEQAKEIGTRRAAIKKAKKEIFEESSLFKAGQAFRKVGQSLGKAGKAARKVKLKPRGVGVAQEDIFFGSGEQPRRKGKRRSRQDIEDDMFGELGTDRFF